MVSIQCHARFPRVSHVGVITSIPRDDTELVSSVYLASMLSIGLETWNADLLTRLHRMRRRMWRRGFCRRPLERVMVEIALHSEEVRNPSVRGGFLR